MPKKSNINYLINKDYENEVLNAIKNIDSWDGRLKPIKEIVNEQIEYNDIKIIIKDLKNKNKI